MTGTIKLNSRELKKILKEYFEIDFQKIAIEDSGDNATIEIFANQHTDVTTVAAGKKLYHLSPITKTMVITFNY